MNNDIKDLEGLEVFLDFTCNLKCKFCFQKQIRERSIGEKLSFEYIKKILDKGLKDGKRFVIFSGGEPTLRNDLIDLIKYSRKKGYKIIRVHSNGYGFKSKEYLEKLYKAGLNGITISIHGFGNKQDEISGIKGNFKFLNKALVNINELIKKEKSFILDTNTVIFKGNKDNLLKLFLYLFKFNINRAQINYSSSMEEFSLANKKEILIEYEKIIGVLEKILLLSKRIGKKVVLDSIPYCVLPKKIWIFLDKNIKNDRESLSLWGHDFSYEATYDDIKLEKCMKCVFNNKCRGIPKDYYDVFGEKDIVPIKY